MFLLFQNTTQLILEMLPSLLFYYSNFLLLFLQLSPKKIKCCLLHIFISLYKTNSLISEIVLSQITWICGNCGHYFREKHRRDLDKLFKIDFILKTNKEDIYYEQNGRRQKYPSYLTCTNVKWPTTGKVRFQLI